MKNLGMESASREIRFCQKTIFFLLLLFGISAVCFGGDLKPFTTDGCSSFPDGTPDNRALWVNCCIRHDLSYWKGGTSQERLDADLALQNCVKAVGETEVARLMLAGVRAGGSPYFPTPYRWGYGWPYARGYRTLSTDELVQVQQRLQDLELLLRGVIKELAGEKK